MSLSDQDNMYMDQDQIILPSLETPREINIPVIDGSYDELADKFKHEPYFNHLIFSNESTYEFNSEDLEYKGNLAVSQYVVKKCLHKKANKILAVKVIPIPLSRFSDSKDNQLMNRTLREILIHIKCSSKYVVRFYGFCIHQESILICMEYMDMSLYNLYPQIHEDRKYFPEQLLGYIAVSVVNAICDLLKVHIIHRDIKPDNILINNNGEIKLCDFSESKFLKTNNYATTFVGTFQYLAPERLIYNSDYKYDERSDVWSLGITLIELILNRSPYIKSDQERQKLMENGNFVFFQYHILNTKPDVIINQINCNNGISKISDASLKFLKCCLCELDERARFSQLQKEEFYRKYAKINKDKIKNLVIIKLIN